MEKTYLALVRGGEKSFLARSGEIRDALEFSDGRVSIGESCAAKFAATDWELLASSVRIFDCVNCQSIHMLCIVARCAPFVAQAYSAYRTETPAPYTPGTFLTQYVH